MPLDAARDMIYFRLAADANEFLTIAKFRAIRKLWARVEEACGLTPKPALVAAETAWRMMTRRDPYVNMLRTTVATAAAGLGGADNIAVLPHTAAIGLPDAFARRVARNTQLVLLEESNLAKVSDPAAGSGAIEDLTDQALRHGLVAISGDRQGGGRMGRARARPDPEACRGACAPSAKRPLRTARTRITGTSDYPDLHERPRRVLDVARLAAPKEASAKPTAEPLPRIRLAEPFEELRDASDRTLAKTGTRPKVFLATLGRLAEFTARAMFAKNFYEAGGIEATNQ